MISEILRLKQSDRQYKCRYLINTVSFQRDTQFVHNTFFETISKGQGDVFFLYYQLYHFIRLTESLRMRDDHRPNLLLGNRYLIPTHI